MFAAIAIAAYELASWLNSKLHISQLMIGAYCVVAACAVIVGLRWIVRRIRARRRRDHSLDEDDWRNY
jgi:hypothetical protein